MLCLNPAIQYTVYEQAAVDAVPDAVEAASDAAAVAMVAWTSSRINSSKVASSMRLGPVSVM